MNDSQKPQFLHLLATTLAKYGKSMPEAAIAKTWIAEMAPYPFDIVRKAIQMYCDENGEFAPVPAGIAKRCKLLDSRPGPDEAWAISLNSQDESKTVVWTSECAAAFALCQSVLETGDKVAARMTFKEVYTRMVAEARALHSPVVWVQSIGWSDRGSDELRALALADAARRGILLPAPVAGLLEGPQSTSDACAREKIQAIKKILADSQHNKLRKAEQRRYKSQRDDLLWKASTNSRVEEYLRNPPNKSGNGAAHGT